MRASVLLGLAASVGVLAGCADIGCVPSCHSHSHNSSSLVEFLYPAGQTPPAQDAIPQLPVPMRVGVAFLPSNESAQFEGPDATHKEALLERIRQRFLSRRFIADIVVIPDYYLTGKHGFEGLQGVQRLYGVDLMALVSYDQVVHEDDNKLSLGYLTIVGAYVLPGTRHDVSTLVDLAVVDPVTRSLVLRAGGTDTRHGTSTMIESRRDSRVAGTEGYSAATDQMIEHFDASLTKFEADVRSGKAAVRLVSKNAGHSSGGGGAFGWQTVLALLLLVTFRAAARPEGTAS